MCKTLKEVNEGGRFLNEWVYQQTKDLLDKGKLVGLVGGDHSTPLGYFKAIAEVWRFGILQIDAHCDLRIAYEGFIYSHASIMFNALSEIPELKKLIQIGVRDYSDDEWKYICNSQHRVVTYFDKELKEREYEGAKWVDMVNEVVEKLPEKVLISFDVDGLDQNSVHIPERPLAVDWSRTGLLPVQKF
jgi:agmatinase